MYTWTKGVVPVGALQCPKARCMHAMMHAVMHAMMHALMHALMHACALLLCVCQVITIFSAPNYCDVYNNKGAVLKFEVKIYIYIYIFIFM